MTVSRKNNSVNSLLSELGKIPPQATDMEDAVLGAIMLEKDAVLIASDILTPDAFYKEQHKEIFSAALRLFHRNAPIDILTITQELRAVSQLDFVGGAFYISELTNRVASAAHLEYHARIVQDKYLLRKLIEISSKIQRDAFEEGADPFDLLSSADLELNQVNNSIVGKEDVGIREALTDAMQEIEIASNHAGGIAGIPSGFYELDIVTHGWQPTSLIIIAARPGMGKTSLAMQLARNAAVNHKKPVGVFSLEQSTTQLTKRLISLESGIAHDNLVNGNLKDADWHQIHAKTSKLASSLIRIDDTPALTISALRSKARRMKRKFGIELLIVDYLQQMNGRTGDNRSMNREQEITAISEALKGLAKELNIPVIALAQLSREVERRGGKKPQLSDLRESGGIEQAADQVIFLYRPEYYGMEKDDLSGESLAGLGFLIVAKNRHGRTETDGIKLGFDGPHYRFYDLKADNYNEPNF